MADDEELTEKLAKWRKIQEIGQKAIRLENINRNGTIMSLETITAIGAIDISYINSSPDDKTSNGYVCLTLAHFPSMKPYFQLSLPVTIVEPYVSGYLAFREADAIITMYKDFCKTYVDHPTILMPDILIIDGCGIYHERGFGLACQVGLGIGIPTIGISKSPVLLDGLGDIQSRCDKFWESNSYKMPMYIYGKNGKFCGYALRGPTSKKPCYVSPGHLISAELSVEVAKIIKHNADYDIVKMADKGGRVCCGQ